MLLSHRDLQAPTESETLHFVLLRQASICLRLSVEGDSPNLPMFRSDGPCGYLKANKNPAFGGVYDLYLVSTCAGKFSC